MDIRHQSLTNTTWEPYNNIAMEDHSIVHGHDQHPFDHTQWPKPPNYYNPQIHNHNNQPSLLPSPNLLNSAQTGTSIKGEILRDQDFMEEEEKEEELGAIKEMMFKIAAMQPVDIDPATIRRPRRRNVRISDDPQSVAARHRRERISEKIRILQRLVPGGSKMDTASMLDEAIRYVKFLKRQIRILQANHLQPPCVGIPTTVEHEDLTAAASGSSYLFDGAGNNIY